MQVNLEWAMENNYSHYSICDVITTPRPNFHDGLFESPFKLGHGNHIPLFSIGVITVC